MTRERLRDKEGGTVCDSLCLITGNCMYANTKHAVCMYVCIHTVLLSCFYAFDCVCSACAHACVSEFCMRLFLLPKDTLCVCLVYGLVGLVDVLHGDGVRELVEHPLLESLQPLVVMAAAHKLLILQRGWGWEGSRGQRGVSLTSSGRELQLQPQLQTPPRTGPVTSLNGIE